MNVISNYSPILLLDEPTNHLDKIGKDYLKNILKYYYGTLIIVSHDRALIDQIADRFGYTRRWHNKSV